MDYAPPFQMGHPLAFALAEEMVKILPRDIDHVFFGNSGSEAVDTALKIALAYWQAKGQPQRVRFIGRARGYHGVGFGGMAVGGIEANRKQFAANLLPAGRSCAAHARSLAQRVLARTAGARRRLRGVARGDGREARRRYDRRVHHRTGRGIDRRAHSAEGLSRAHPRDLRQARHPAHLRRGHHRLRPTRRIVRGDEVQRHAGHDDGREGHHQRGGADGRGLRARQHLRDGRQRRRRRHRAVPRLHVFGPSARRGRRDSRRCRVYKKEGLFERAASLESYWEDAIPFAARLAARHRRPHDRYRRRHRAGAEARCAGRARL